VLAPDSAASYAVITVCDAAPLQMSERTARAQLAELQMQLEAGRKFL